ncbi:hypothetical protein PsorP6_001213 [Peronosclerospora sorghi]|uniref:Uncharacterized protein n=1 Tax=Peronosclerospora sorghi TaxID=230839 RepID=A0ACC0WVG8_9STRA|nr:hypothetical protein PsorP6_001213 [Peronosclerospora sorghi]
MKPSREDLPVPTSYRQSAVFQRSARQNTFVSSHSTVSRSSIDWKGPYTDSITMSKEPRFGAFGLRVGLEPSTLQPEISNGVPSQL